MVTKKKAAQTKFTKMAKAGSGKVGRAAKSTSNPKKK